VDVTYCILEHGNQDPSVGPLQNWMLYPDTPLQTGYSPLRWRVAIDALLLKKAGVNLVEKLRKIVLFRDDLTT
jgi:hypothetical protein